MSRIRADKISNKAGTGAVQLQYGAEVPAGYGITGAGTINVTGVITAASFAGSGANLTGIDATSIKDTGGSVKIQAQASGAVHTGIATFNNDIDVDGHTNLDNVSVAGIATFGGNRIDIATWVSHTGDPDTRFGFYGPNELTFETGGSERLRINSSGLTVPAGNVTAVDGTFTGNVSVGATLTYEDVTNIDSVGLITARNGINVTGVSTFVGEVNIDGNILLDDPHALGFGASGEKGNIYHSSSNLHVANAVGDVYITTVDDDKDIIIQTDNGSGGLVNYFLADGSTGESILYHYGTEKIKTSSSGITVTGTVAATAYTGDGSALTGITQTTINNNANNRIITGSNTANTLEAESSLTWNGTTLENPSGAFSLASAANLQINAASNMLLDAVQQVQIKSDSYIETQSTRVEFKNQADNATIAAFYEGSRCELYFNGSEKLETSNTGITVTGGIQATGSNTAITCNTTNSNITFTSSGSNANLNHYASGSNSQIKLLSTGSNSVYKLDANGSNGLGYLDGLNGVRLYHGGNFSNQKLTTTSTGVSVTGDIDLAEGKKTIFGSNSGSGAYIKHQSGHFELKNQTGNFYFDNVGALHFRTGASYTTALTINPNQSCTFTAGVNIGPGVLAEKFHNDTGGGITSNYTHQILTYGMVWYGSTNAAGAWTFNVQGNGSTTLNSLMAIGETTTMTMYSANNNTANYMTAFKVDGSTITVKWAGGTAPSAATGSGTDVYSMTIMKTANATFTVFGNFTNFA